MSTSILTIIIVCSFAVGALLGGIAMLCAIAICADAKRADEAEAKHHERQRQIDAEVVVSLERALRDRAARPEWDAG